MIGQRVREGLAESDKTLGRVRPSGEWSRTAAVSDVILAVVRDARDVGLSPPPHRRPPQRVRSPVAARLGVAPHVGPAVTARMEAPESAG
jgi:hypothetical protein